MIYRVVMDGNDILDYGDRDLSLIDPHLELEINAAGSLEFVMPPNHKYYDAVRIRKSTIEVYEDDTMIWFGRPIDEKIDFFKQKKIYCEGPLSFFNDSIMRPLEMENITLHGFFSTAVYSHNGQVDDNRMFTVGNITIPDSTVYRKFDYETTYDVLQKMCIETNDGYLFFRRQNNVNYIDWLKDMPFSCNQTICFGINLLNYSSNFDTSDFATCVLPVGKADSETGEALTIASINGGSDIIVSEAAQTYGKVTQVVRLSDIEDQYELMSEGQKYLENSQFNALNIECTAADLHSMNPELELFRVGQNVHCVSEPHLVDRDFPLSKMQINLDSAAKLITLGIIKRRTLTRIYKQESEDATSYTPEQYQPEQYDPGVIEDENGDEWEIKMPEENGDPVTAVRMPTKITIAKPPNKMEYAPGETIDYTGISVNIWTKNKGDQEVIWTNPPKYLDGKAPFSELSFSMKTAPNGQGIEGFSVVVTWKYKGKSYNTTLELKLTNETMWTDDDGINAIEATFSPVTSTTTWKKVYPGRVDTETFYVCNKAVGTISGHPATIGSGDHTVRVLLTMYNETLYVLPIGDRCRVNTFRKFANELTDDGQVVRDGWFLVTGTSSIPQADYFTAVSLHPQIILSNIPMSEKDPANMHISQLHEI